MLKVFKYKKTVCRLLMGEMPVKASEEESGALSVFYNRTGIAKSPPKSHFAMNQSISYCKVDFTIIEMYCKLLQIILLYTAIHFVYGKIFCNTVQ